jgi:excisionase family DNA binding protein
VALRFFGSEKMTTEGAAGPGLPKLHSARQVAEATGLSLYRVYELCRLGVLPHRRLGRSIRFSADSVAAFLNGSDAPPPPATAKPRRKRAAR